ncbi:MAG: acetate--CoA ligase family protein [Spirochaetaceae bacterium]|nr:MAG: acetate--CoA ligase family protein [Spirochaetaceae bacterium]
MNGTGIAVLVEQWRSSLAIPGTPNEWESKRLINGMGIAVPRAVFIPPENAKTPDGDLSVLGGPGRCVVKVCSGDILHKTEEGGVLLDVAEPSLPAAVSSLQQRFPKAAVLVEEMVSSRGSEIIIGALHDPTFGPAVMAGAGGILTELYKDVSFRLAPCTAQEARYMLEELTIYPTLRGYRGLCADVDSLALIIERIAELAVQLIDQGCQLDINPIVWDSKRWVALDVKLVLA